MNNENFHAGEQQGLILGELKALRGSLDDLKTTIQSFEKSMWPKIDDHSKNIEVLKAQVGWIWKLGTMVIAPTIAGLVYALFKVISK